MHSPTSLYIAYVLFRTSQDESTLLCYVYEHGRILSIRYYSSALKQSHDLSLLDLFLHRMLGYFTYYSQFIRSFRLCNNINDFLFRAKFSYSKLVKRGYKHSLLLKYFKRFCSAYNIEGKYGEKNSDLLFSLMLKHNHFVFWNINNIKEINDIVKSGYVKIMPLTRRLECEWTNKSPLPTNVFDTWYCECPPPPPPTHTHTHTHTGYILDIYDSGGYNSCSLRDVAECSILCSVRNFYLIVILSTRQETLGYLARYIHHSL